MDAFQAVAARASLDYETQIRPAIEAGRLKELWAVMVRAVASHSGVTADRASGLDFDRLHLMYNVGVVDRALSEGGILWRTLGDDGEAWSSPDAWSVVADWCEAQGHAERAQRVRVAVDAVRGWQPPCPKFSAAAAQVLALSWADMLNAGDPVVYVRDTDGASISVGDGDFMQPPRVARRAVASNTLNGDA